jgi:hypothetical protein
VRRAAVGLLPVMAGLFGPFAIAGRIGAVRTMQLRFGRAQGTIAP